MSARSRFVAAFFSFVVGLVSFSAPSRAQTSYQWHTSFSQQVRNWYVYYSAQSYPNGYYGGECKQWVQWVVYYASNRNVWLPQNSSCDWMWVWGPGAEIVAQDRWDGFPLYPGQIIQAQVRTRTGGTSPHTMIVVASDANSISVIECNYSGTGQVGRRTVSWYDFRRSIIHYTLYQVR